MANRNRGTASVETSETSASASTGAEVDMTVTDWSAGAASRVAAIAEGMSAAVVAEPTEVERIAAEVAEIEAALAVATRPSIVAALNGELETARGALALAEAEAGRLQERASAEAEAYAAVAGITNEARRATALSAMLAAIEAEYAPVPQVAEVAVEAEVAAGRRQASDRQLERNAAVASDADAVARGGRLFKAFDSDGSVLRCKAARKPNTRFPSLAALAPSGDGVANAADYDTAVRAVRAYMVANGWPRSESDGATTAESKWLAARGRFASGQAKFGDRAQASFGSAAEIALYPDGRFRLALPSTPNVRFLSRDNGAWQAFVGVTAGAVQPTVTVAPAAPTSTAEPYVAVAKTARCHKCGASNVVGHSDKCRNCGTADWQAGA